MDIHNFEAHHDVVMDLECSTCHEQFASFEDLKGQYAVARAVLFTLSAVTRVFLFTLSWI
jgi:hypothetical protein